MRIQSTNSESELREASRARNLAYLERKGAYPPAERRAKGPVQRAEWPARAVAIVGGLLIVFGVFAPIVAIPIQGEVNLFSRGAMDWMVLLSAGLGAFVLGLLGRLIVPTLLGVGVIGYLGWFSIAFSGRVATLSDSLGAKLTGSPFQEAAVTMLRSAHLDWGFAVLLIGALLLCAASLVRMEPPKRSRQ